PRHHPPPTTFPYTTLFRSSRSISEPSPISTGIRTCAWSSASMRARSRSISDPSPMSTGMVIRERSSAASWARSPAVSTSNSTGIVTLRPASAALTAFCSSRRKPSVSGTTLMCTRPTSRPPGPATRSPPVCCSVRDGVLRRLLGGLAEQPLGPLPTSDLVERDHARLGPDLRLRRLDQRFARPLPGPLPVGGVEQVHGGGEQIRLRCPGAELVAALQRGAKRRIGRKLPGEPEHVPRRHRAAWPPQVAQVHANGGQVVQQRRAVLLDQLAELDASPGWLRCAYTWNVCSSTSSAASSAHFR